MQHSTTANKSQKWDMVFLILCIIFFLVSSGATIFFVSERNEAITQLQVTHYQKSLYLNELDHVLGLELQGDKDAAKALSRQTAKMRDLESTIEVGLNDWKTILVSAELTNNQYLALRDTPFFNKADTVSEITFLANEAKAILEKERNLSQTATNYLLLLSTADNMITPLYSGDLARTSSAINFANKLLEFDPAALPENVRDTAINANKVFAALSEHREEISNFIKEASLTIEKTRSAIQAEELRELTPGSSLKDQIADVKDRTQNTIFALAGLSALLLLLILIVIFRVLNARKNDSFNAARQNKKNEEAIMEMLDAMMKLSEGDLTVQAKVSDNITGTLADSFNVSVEELRALVAAVNASSDNLSGSVTNTTEFVDNYTEAALSQANQISEAADTVSHVVQAMLDVSAQTSAAVDIAMSSTEVARSGSERVRSTITGMDQIREHIQETSKRIKRLGESSQEIGDVVELINDIADQTHILALNAAIQASVAGEAGKGFAVVADEVQRLAERTGNATQRVEDLVKTIQTDTNEAIFAMEKSTSEVVNGANLAERAGESLNEIESVSGRLAALIQSVSQASREVSELGSKVKSSMDSVKEISEESVNNTKTTKSSIDHILKLANELKSSVAGFKID